MNKEAFLKKLWQQLDELNHRWNIERDKLEAMAQKASAEAKKKFDLDREDLSKLRKQMKEKIIELEVAGENAWDEVKDSADETWRALNKSFKKALARATPKEESLKKMKQQLDELNRRWHHERIKLEARAQLAGAEAKKKFEVELEDLSKLRKHLKEKIIELEIAGENAWDEAKDNIDEAMKALSERFKKAISRFK